MLRLSSLVTSGRMRAKKSLPRASPALMERELAMPTPKMSVAVVKELKDLSNETREERFVEIGNFIIPKDITQSMHQPHTLVCVLMQKRLR